MPSASDTNPPFTAPGAGSLIASPSALARIAQSGRRLVDGGARAALHELASALGSIEGVDGAAVIALDVLGALGALGALGDGSAQVIAAAGSLQPWLDREVGASALPSCCQRAIASAMTSASAESEALPDSPGEQGLHRSAGQRAIAVPVLVDSRVVALLYVITDARAMDAAADGRAGDALERAADAAALAMYVRLVEQRAERREHAAAALGDIIQSFNQSLEFERIVQLLATQAAMLLGADVGLLGMLEGTDLIAHGYYGLRDGAIRRRNPLSGTAGSVAVEARRPVRFDDLRAEPVRWPLTAQALEHLPRANAVIAPLLIGGRPTGVLMVAGNTARDFDEHDEQLLEVLTRHAAVAIENSRLYRAAALAARRATILAETGRTLTTDLTPPALFASIGRIASRTLGASGFSVYFADPESRHVELAHTAGAEGLALPRVAGWFWKSSPGRALQSGLPHFVRDLREDGAADLAGAAPTAPDEAEQLAVLRSLVDAQVRAIAFLPLSVEGRTRGLLTLRFRERRAFDEAEQQLFRDFATQVAVGIRNARLLTDLERRAARFAAVAQVQQDIAGTVSLHDAYDAVHRAVVSVVDATRFTLYTVSPDGSLTAAFVAGDAAAHAAANEEVPSLVLETQRSGVERIAVHLDPESSGEGGVPVHAIGADVPSVGVIAAELYAPLLHGTDSLGVLRVQSSRYDAYDLQDLELITLVARQAAAAIETARLFTAQRREWELAEASEQIARLALDATSVMGCADAILPVLDRAVPSAGKALNITRQREGMLRCVAASGTAVHSAGMVVPIERTFRPDIVMTGRSLVVPNMRDAIHPDMLELTNDEWAIVLPLASKGRILGTLIASAPCDAPLTPEAQATLERLAASVALALDVQLLGEEERRRRERERTLAIALETMDQPVFILDNGRVQYANAAAEEEYGYGAAELVGMAFEQLVSETAESPRTGSTVLEDRGVWMAEHVHRRRDGTEFPVSVVLSHIPNESGALVGQVLCVRNTSEERRIAEHLRQTEKLVAVGELVAGVAHEINNPLTGISAFAQLLLEESLTDDQVESVRLIKREADRAVGVIRDLLVFSRKTEPRHGPVMLDTLLEQLLRLRSYALRSGGIEVEMDLEPALPPVRADHQKLQQVFLNLVTNAEYAMHESAVRRLQVRTRLVRDTASVEIIDSGSGMSPDVMRRVFEPFFTTKPAGIGTGLGLSVSYGIVKAHGGELTVSSVPGKGTTFCVTLPLAKDEDDDLDFAPRPPISTTTPSDD